MQRGYIVAIVLFALFWVAALFIPGGRGEAIMAVCGFASLGAVIMTYLTPPKDY